MAIKIKKMTIWENPGGVLGRRVDADVYRNGDRVRVSKLTKKQAYELIDEIMEG